MHCKTKQDKTKQWFALATWGKTFAVFNVSFLLGALGCYCTVCKNVAYKCTAKKS